MTSARGRVVSGAQSLVRQFGRNSAGSVASQFVLMGTGLITVYVLTQTLGRLDYGNYATALALVYVSAPLLEIGINHVLARSLATNDQPGRVWAISFTTHVLGAFAGAGALMALQPALLPEVPRLVVGLLVLSEMTGPALVAGAVLAFEGVGRGPRGTQIRVLSAATKLAALGVLALLPRPSLILWCVLQVSAALVSALLTIRFVERELGLRVGFQLPTWVEAKFGLSFAANQVASTGQKDADKVIMGYYSLNGQAADYTAGYRFVAMGLIPLTGLVSGTYGQFFRSGKDSVSSVVTLAVRLTAASMAFVLPISAMLFFGADLLPFVLGDDFTESTDVVRLLAALPVLKAVQGFANNALVGAGFVVKRVRAVVATLGINVGLNLLWVPEHGWRGAAWATLIVEAILAVTLWGSLIRANQPEASSAVVGDDGTVEPSTRD